MAASSMKPSPSNKSVAKDSEEATTASEACDAAKYEAKQHNDHSKNEKEAIVSTAVVSEPTYYDSEASKWYTTGRQLLDDGDFEAAMMTIEEGIEFTKGLILKCRQETNPELSEADLDDDDDFTLHESLAPLHYLYGTTLLYSIEESDANQAMTVGGQPPETTESSNIDEYEEDPEMDVNNSGDGPHPDEDQEEDGENEENHQPVEDNTEDMQIAWENLDLARAIIERMLSKDSDLMDATKVAKLKSDLAQVYLREGDLQRTNSKYEESVGDYKQCLKLLLQATIENQNKRKIADVHYNVGLTYFMFVAATNSSATEDLSYPTEGPEQQTTIRSTDMQEKLNAARSHGFYHYVACALTLGEILAEYSKVVAVDFIQNALSDIPNMKNSGEEDEEEMEDPKVASVKVKALREHVNTLPKPPVDVQHKFHDLKELLDEIQETIDEAEASEKGVSEVTMMKEQIANAVAAQAAPEDEEGFGSSSATLPTTTIGFGNAASANVDVASLSTTTLQVRKKAPKRDTSDNAGDANNKRRKSCSE